MLDAEVEPLEWLLSNSETKEQDGGKDEKYYSRDNCDYYCRHNDPRNESYSPRDYRSANYHLKEV